MHTVTRRLRIRELAGDDRAGTWARAKARTRQRDHLRRNWRHYATGVLVMAVAPLIIAAALSNGFLIGLVLGASLVAIPGAVWVLVLQVTGTSPAMMGDQAEQWSAGELRRLHRHGWRLVNHVSFAHHDIDHVLLGPGGAYVVETKWTAATWGSDDGDDRLAAADHQTRANARTIQLWGPFKAAAITVTPVLVVWGGPPDDTLPPSVSGVPVVAGRDLRAWTATLGTGALTDHQLEAGWDALDAYLTKRDPREAAEHPLPRSIPRLIAAGGLTTAAAILGFLLVAQTLSMSQSAPLAGAVGVLAALPTVLLLRLRVTAAPAWGWITGTAGSATALTLAHLLYRAN